MIEYIMQTLRALTQNLPAYDSAPKAVGYTTVIGITAVGFVCAAVESYQTEGLSMDCAQKALIGCTASVMACGSVVKAYDYFADNN